MQIADNNRTDVVSKNMMQIFKNGIRILQMWLQILQITTSTSICTPLVSSEARTPMREK
jgi:hypothetical protein